jgi:hypothetical protein
MRCDFVPRPVNLPDLILTLIWRFAGKSRLADDSKAGFYPVPAQDV